MKVTETEDQIFFMVDGPKGAVVITKWKNKPKFGLSFNYHAKYPRHDDQDRTTYVCNFIGEPCYCDGRTLPVKSLNDIDCDGEYESLPGEPEVRISTPDHCSICGKSMAFGETFYVRPIKHPDKPWGTTYICTICHPEFVRKEEEAQK